MARIPAPRIHEFEAGSPPPPPELATKEGKNRGGPLNPARLSAMRQKEKRADLAIPKPPFPTAIFDASLLPLKLRYDSWTPLCPEHSIPPEAEVD